MPDVSSLLSTVSTRFVALHKQQFGRGPTRARTEWAGADALLIVLDDALLPAELALVEHGDGHRVAEQRLFMQRATHGLFVGEMEALVGRAVRSFTSACDPEHSTVFEVFTFEPRDG